MKYLFSFLFSMCALLSLSQYDASVTASFLPTTLSMGQTGELRVIVNNLTTSGVAIPVGALYIGIDAPENFYNLASPPTGNGTAFFTTWNNPESGFFWATNSVEIPAFMAKQLNFAVNGVSSTPPMTGATTSINLIVTPSDPIGGNNSSIPGLIVLAPLPLDLISFDAKSKLCEGNELQWQTANEVLVDRIVLMRSNNNKDFVEVYTVKGANNAKQNYSFIDKDVKFGLAYTYVLKQYDYDGRETRLGTEYCTADCNIADPILEIYPNPSREIVNMELKNMSNQSFEMKLYNANSELIFQRNFESIVDFPFTLDIKTFTPGVYTVLLENENTQLQKRFIKIE